MITFIRIKPVRIDGEGRTVAIVHIAVASASELPTKYLLDGFVIHEASKAWDISTGTQYGFLDNGGWIQQPGGSGSSGSIVTIKGTVASANQLPSDAEPGWLYFVKPLGASESDEYVYTESQVWDKVGSTTVSITVDSALSNASENPVQNKVVTNALNGKADKATTLAGYGITDAKIASGTITLGSDTITPLTSSDVASSYSSAGTAPVNGQAVASAISGKQNTLVVGTNLDDAPTSGSNNPITSGAVYDVVGDINSILEAIL